MAEADHLHGLLTVQVVLALGVVDVQVLIGVVIVHLLRDIDVHPLQLVQRNEQILFPTLVGILGTDAADHLVEDGAAGVQVGPGALAASGAVLLLRGIAALENNGEILLFLQVKFPGSTEVDESEGAVGL